jgi:hypothetical protein
VRADAKLTAFLELEAAIRAFPILAVSDACKTAPDISP